jgi:tetratricopeptide (TPR) repeat protein
VVITSCRSDQQSFEAEDYHRGLFTHYLIKGLTGEARTDSTSKKISVLDLYNYLNNSLAAECAKRCREQQPDVKGDLTADWALPLRLTNVEDIFVARPHKVIPEPKPEPPPPVEDKCAEEAAQVVEPPVAKSAAPKEAMAQEIRQKIVEGHFREAELALDKYFNNFNEDVNYLFLRGLWAYQQDRLRTAGRYFDSCVRADPGHQEALEGLDNVESRARYYRTMAAVKKKQAEKTGERGDYKKAIGILTSVIETIVPLEDEAERKAIVNRIAELRATKKADIGPAPQTKKHAPVGPPVQLPATLRVGPPPAGGRSMAGVKMGPVASHAEPIVAAQPTFDAPDAEMAPPFEFAPEEPLVEDVYATDAATTPVDPWPVEPTIVETPAAGPTSAYRLRARSRTPAYDTEQTVVFPDESTVVTPVSPPQAEADHHYGKIIAAVVAVTCIIVLIAMVIFLRSSNREAVTAPTARPQSEAVPAPAPKPVAAPAPSPTPAPAAAEEPPHHKPKPPKPPTKTPPPPTPRLTSRVRTRCKPLLRATHIRISGLDQRGRRGVAEMLMVRRPA